MTKPQLVTFLGWCSILNISLLCVSAIFLIALSDLIRPLHSNLLNMPERDLTVLYANCLPGSRSS